jgi:hypothetical protein
MDKCCPTKGSAQKHGEIRAIMANCCARDGRAPPHPPTQTHFARSPSPTHGCAAIAEGLLWEAQRLNSNQGRGWGARFSLSAAPRGIECIALSPFSAINGF